LPLVLSYFSIALFCLTAAFAPHREHEEVAITQLNSFVDVQQFIRQILVENGEQGGVAAAPHGDFWLTLSYDAFVNGDVPSVHDPNTNLPMPVLVRGNAAQSNIILALRGEGPLFGADGVFGQMPANGPPFFSTDQIDSIGAWIDRGCPE
jgi:hypothetical protein